ncbi:MULTISPECIES: hypothetical protein [Shewanella]|uniref:Uncharacterized protein n=1 Tax=Shewanella marisflavi TaxID=260364 RepID=A0ABX5WL41_9GAMM|nr:MULTISPECIES: hypothetical protein [Shewanella]QDF75298.1 hypothetical protein FGA12_09095 [Shewanella marisflavi]
MNLENFKPGLENKITRLVMMPKSFVLSIKATWQRLTLPQRLYLLAALLLASDSLGLVAIITTIALTLEFWPVFERVWHSLAGKAILLLFYAIVANYALAMAGAIVNEVVGVPATHFNYTHNFAILLLLPAWVLGISAVGLLFAQIIMPLYLFIALLLKPIGIKLFSLTANSHYRFTTLLVRFVLSFVLLYHLILLIGNVEEQVETAFSDIKKIENTVTMGTSKTLSQQPELTEARLKEEKADTPTPSTASPFMETNLEQQSNAVKKEEDEPESLAQEYAKVRLAYQQEIRQLIAQFAYHLEADGRSRCEKRDEANVVELNDYEILEVVPDEQAKYRYRFTVRECISAAFPLK